MAAPNLSNFTSELRVRNIARPNLYYVEIFPPGLKPSSNKLVSMWCNGAMTPQTTISTQDDYIEAGTRRKYAYDIDYQNLVLNFYIDQEFEVLQFFDQWKKLIVSHQRNFNYPNIYTAEKLNVYLINQEDAGVYLYEYSRIYPKTIQSVELSYATGNAVAAFSVEFVFEDVYYTKLTNGIKDLRITSKPSTGDLLNDYGTSGIENNELLQALMDSTTPVYDDSPVDMSLFDDPYANPPSDPTFSSNFGGNFGGGGATGTGEPAGNFW